MCSWSAFQLHASPIKFHENKYIDFNIGLLQGHTHAHPDYTHRHEVDVSGCDRFTSLHPEIEQPVTHGFVPRIISG
jgi:hypothetical protein